MARCMLNLCLIVIGITVSSVAAAAANPTLVKVQQYNFTMGTQVYQRYGLFGEGDQWVTENGIGFLRVPQGEELYVTYLNQLENEPTIIHGHGQEPNLAQDGVPDVSAPPLQPGQSFTIRYMPKKGTFWLHSHWGDQHELGASLPMIAEEDFPENYPNRAEFQGAKDVIMSLDNFCPYSADETNPTCFDASAVFEDLHSAWRADKPHFNFTQCEDPNTSGDVFYRHHLV